MTDGGNVLSNVLSWIHKGYPEGVSPSESVPLLALLKRSLTEEEVVEAARVILKGGESDTVTPDQILAAIEQVTATVPNPEEMHQVAARLASVGWPLAVPAR